MATQRRGFPEDVVFQEIKRAELTMSIQTLWIQLFIFILFCAVLTISMPRWFAMNDHLNTLWYWALVVAVALAAIIKEYERHWHQAFNERW
ncbi:hypothetical protein RHGRI_001473 [Rhododendron griersonianum]|uniref:Cation-transporting P-type ATPase C-terminal domain-containing protein n=1 Tax=Rhododendron griersonianum TaxID=479676 RepID=A0AAV6LK92_9ERIC|nr:hypothetical protein RHGRI_001473 [Rhododendron griersonianum]